MNRRARTAATHRYPRTARVNEVLREVVASELERVDDERLGLVTVTGVTTDPDLRRASVWVASLPEPAAEALAEHRPRLQAAIARQVRMKHTPELSFRADPAVSAGQRIEDILRGLEP